MTINLEDYLNKIVEVELRNGKIKTGKVDRTYGVFYISESRRTNGMTVEYCKDGTNFCLDDSIDEPLYDIIKIKEIKELPTEPETMTNVIRSKIDVFTAYGERVELTVDDDGVFLTHCEDGGAREDLSIGSKDLAIAVAKAILEHYGVN